MIEEKDDAEGGDDVIEIIAVVEMPEDREFQQKPEGERCGDITPNTSVRPAAIKNKSTPSCRPFKI